MTPYFSDDWLTIYQGDVRDVLPTLPAESVDCIVTSPPFWGLRDYGTATWSGGDADCDHVESREFVNPKNTLGPNGHLPATNAANKMHQRQFTHTCGKCGAIRSDAQIGLERTPEEYVANLVGVFRELRRVLKPSGTAWCNLGDSFLPGKQLAGVPWRVAFALQADGWYLRSDIIWAKPNPMPESVTDRPTKSHEYLFLLTRSARYFFDADAVREAGQPGGSHSRGNGASVIPNRNDQNGRDPLWETNPAGRNLRSVWTIATRPYPGAHFAVFPPELPERCIKAGSSERGVCPQCGAPWERQTVKTTRFEGGSGKAGRTAEDANANGKWAGKQYGTNIKLGPVVDVETTGWRPACPSVVHSGNPAFMVPDPAVVLDPFAGSGTTGMVANRLSRRAILIDLNGDYLKQQLQRNAQTPLGLGAA